METLGSEADSRRRVVILGCGFGGLAAAKALAKAPVALMVIDRANHHLFQPLLYQVATAALNPSEIAAPIRRILRHQKNTEVILAEATRIDVRMTDSSQPVLDARGPRYRLPPGLPGMPPAMPQGHAAFERRSPGWSRARADPGR